MTTRYCEIDRVNDYSNPKGTTIEITYKYKPGYFIDHPRNEREFLDPGCPDEMEIISAVIYRGKRSRQIDLSKCSQGTTTYLESAVIESLRR